MYIQCNVDYQWDPIKAESNKKKHGIDFADAIGVFEDEWSLTINEQIVGDEQRLATVAVDFLGHIIIVVYTYRGDEIRLISARPATKVERNLYEKRRV
jgi:uncharacterized DUF497 family protein